MADHIISILVKAQDTTKTAYNCVSKEAICILRPPRKITFKEKFVAIDTTKNVSNNAGAAAAEKYDQYLDLKDKGLTDLVNYLKQHPDINYDNFVLIDHGNGGKGLEIGSDVLTSKNIDQYKDLLAQLGSFFPPGSYIHFWHCNVGNNQDLIKKIAEYMGRSVIVSDQFNIPAYNERLDMSSDFMKFNPDGTIDKAQSKDLRDHKDSMIGDILRGKTIE